MDLVIFHGSVPPESPLMQMRDKTEPTTNKLISSPRVPT